MLNKKICQTFYAILSKDIAVYNAKWLSRSIDGIVWMSSVIIVAHYIMPLFGVTNAQFGTFTLIGNFAIWGLFETLTNVALFFGDLQGDKSISYYLSLPLPSYMIFIEQAFASAYRSMASSILILPLGKLILGDAFDLSMVNWPYFIIAFIVINVFYGFFNIFITSYVPDLSSLTMIRSRIIFPLWCLGGFQFTWKMSYQVLPTLAYINLCNPIMYIMDGIRSTVFAPEAYLPFWNCMGMLVLFSILFGYFGIQKLKQRLDCI